MLHFPITRSSAAHVLAVATLAPTVIADDAHSSGAAARTGTHAAGTCTESVGVDISGDCDVDLDDFAGFQLCMTGPDAGPPDAGCENTDTDGDGDVDPTDVRFLPQCSRGPGLPADAECEDATYVQPTALDRIAEELEAGMITELDALRYEVFAVMGDDRLPSRFSGATFEEGTHVMHSLTEGWGDLPAETQAELLPFMLPPDAPGSWYQLRVQGAVGASGGDEPPTGQFAQIDVKDGSDNSVAVIKYPVTEDLLDEATVVFHALNGADGVYEKLTTLMGRQPLSDEDVDSDYNGGDGRYDVYLVPRGGSHYGETTTHSPGFFKGLFTDARRSSFIVMDVAKMAADFPGAALAAKLRANIAHEFMHAVQFAFDRSGPLSEYRWVWDATATWAEHFVFPNDQLEHDDAPFYLRTLDESLEVDLGQRRYGAYLYFFHHVMRLGENIVPATFENAEAADSLTALDRALPGGIADHWAEFAAANWNDTNNPPVDGYEAADGLKQGAADSTSFEIPVLTGPQETLELTLEGDGLEPLSAQYFWLKLNDPMTRSILFANGLTFELEHGVPPLLEAATGDEMFFASRTTTADRDRLHVLALVKQDGMWLPDPLDLTDVAFATFCNEAASESLEELVIIMSNARWEDDERDPVQQPKLKSSLLLSNMGCGGWSGTATNAADIETEFESTQFGALFQPIEFTRDTLSLEEIAAGAGQRQIPGFPLIPAGNVNGLSDMPWGSYRIANTSTGQWNYSSVSGDCSESGSGTFAPDDAMSEILHIAPYLSGTVNNEIPSLYRSWVMEVTFRDGNEMVHGLCVDDKGNTKEYELPFQASIVGQYRNTSLGSFIIEPTGDRMVIKDLKVSEVTITLDLTSQFIP